ncbi:hypothetical protein SteCoe_12068 [Stentor coeruleus]|uniref:Protein kinase domain-containing protein n=1 Tax=Stentor coeruleus TaxID=5963 RepID=A0A1R2CBN0_9CILI|nr:hypothetical protein SteCoe_12068 [Stentor coeruleus]
MSSLFEKADSNSNPTNFWSIPSQDSLKEIQKKSIFQGFLSIPQSASSLKKRKFIITKSKIFYMKKSAKTPKFMSEINWKKVEPFTEECLSDQRFGFRLGHKSIFQDFYTKNASELDLWLDNLSKISIMSDLEMDFAIIKEIGQGNFAEILLAEDLGDHKQFAIKKISKNKLLNGTLSIENEIEIMRKFPHPNIVSLYKIYESESTISLILEYFPEGDLFQRLLKKNRLEEHNAAKLMMNLLDALNFLHENHVIHRDLKLENILMKCSDNDYEIKLGDFGLACISGDEEVLRCGSPGYIAPEILNRQPYSSKVDIFGAGVILYVLLSGNFPFTGKDVGDVLLKNRKCMLSFSEKRWKKTSEYAVDLVKRLMDPNPATRLSSAEALRHPWFYQHTKKRSIETPMTNDIGQNSIEINIEVFKKHNSNQKKDKNKNTRIKLIKQ